MIIHGYIYIYIYTCKRVFFFGFINLWVEEVDTYNMLSHGVKNYSQTHIF